HGVAVDGVSLDLETMLARKDKTVDGLTKGVAFLFRKNKVQAVQGTARITAPGEVSVVGEGGARVLRCANILIATGSDSAPLPGIDTDEKRIVTSTGALALDRVPEHLVVVGGGYIGLELGSVWGRLGSKVT